MLRLLGQAEPERQWRSGLPGPAYPGGMGHPVTWVCPPVRIETVGRTRRKPGQCQCCLGAVPKRGA
jgi:hypothetical protein